MAIYYSAMTGGFYDSRVYKTFPSDAKEISAERLDEITLGQSDGKRVVAGADGFPELIMPQAE